MWPNPLETADLVTFTKEFLNGKLHLLCSDIIKDQKKMFQQARMNNLLIFSKLLQIFLELWITVPGKLLVKYQEIVCESINFFLDLSHENSKQCLPYTLEELIRVDRLDLELRRTIQRSNGVISILAITIKNTICMYLKDS